jgi:tetratricopeptide (TPR) repeat protein
MAVAAGDPFVGRNGALATIDAAVAAAAHGRGSLVLVAGEAGIGKTRLVVEALRPGDDRAGALVLWGSCSEGDGVPPFWPWTEALRPLIGSTAMPPEVVALLPDLAPAGAIRPEPVADEIRFRAFNLVAELLDDVGQRRPVAVVLDDLHWADPSSLELLRAVARRSGTGHFAVVGTYRDTDVEPDHPLHRLLGELARAGPRVVLGGLDPGEVADLIGVAGDRAAAVAERTGGNPFFIREIERAGTGVADLPPAVSDVLLPRIDLASAGARPVLDVAAVLGHVDPTVIAAVLEVEHLGAVEAIDELVHRRLLGRGGAGFAHALVREAVLAALPARRRVELHGRVADAIEARSGTAAVDAIAHHRLQSAPLDEAAAARWAVEAGRAARRQLAYEQAVLWFERAIALGPPATRSAAELLIELADAAGRTAIGLHRGRRAAAEAVEIARRSGDGELLARAAIAYGGPFLGILTGGFAEPEPVALAEEALEAIGSEPSLLRVRLLARVATNLGYTPAHPRALAAAAQALEVARAVGDDDGLIEALTAVTSIWNPADDVAAATPLLDEFDVVSRRRRSREGQLTVTVNRCLLALERGDRADLEGHVARLRRLLGELHLPVHGVYAQLFEAMLQRLDGRYGEAEGELLSALVALGDQAETFVPAGAQLMVVLHEQDRLGEILDDARRLFSSDRFRGVPSGRVVLGYFEAVAGDPAVAADALPALAASWATTQRDPNWLQGLAWLCRTAVVLEDRDAAEVLLELGRPQAARSVFTAAGTITLGVLGMWLAELAILLGRLDDAAELLDGAEAHDRRLQDRGHLVECAYLRGRLAAAARRPDAAALLGAAAAEAEALGMARVARLARTVGTRSVPASGAVFRREGDVWLVRFGGVDARVRDTKGMADLAVLLTRPGVEVHVAELVGAASVAAGAPQAVLDDTAITAYRRRLRDLAADEDDAEAAGDAAGAARARAEREAIADQLAADLGLGGAARSAPDWVERARKAVRRRVDAALKRIEAEHPSAGRHLRRSVVTGAFCVYDPVDAVPWEV